MCVCVCMVADKQTTVMEDLCNLDYKSGRIHRTREVHFGHGGFGGKQSELSGGLILLCLYWVLELVSLVGFYG